MYCYKRTAKGILEKYHNNVLTILHPYMYMYRFFFGMLDNRLIMTHSCYLQKLRLVHPFSTCLPCASGITTMTMLAGCPSITVCAPANRIQTSMATSNQRCGWGYRHAHAVACRLQWPIMRAIANGVISSIGNPCNRHISVVFILLLREVNLVLEERHSCICLEWHRHKDGLEYVRLGQISCSAEANLLLASTSTTTYVSWSPVGLEPHRCNCLVK